MPEPIREDPGWEGDYKSAPVTEGLARVWAFVVGLFRPRCRGLTPRELQYLAESHRAKADAKRSTLIAQRDLKTAKAEAERQVAEARDTARAYTDQLLEKIASLETQLRASEVDRRKLESEVAVQRSELELMAGVLQRERARIEAETAGFASRTAIHTTPRAQE